MKSYRVFHSDASIESPVLIDAIDQKDAIFQFNSMYPDCNSETGLRVEEIIKPVQPLFVRVHLGFVTVNLMPNVAKDLGYKEGDRFKDEASMYAAIATQNILIVEEWYKRWDLEMPTDLNEAFAYMIKKTNNFTENVQN